MRRVEYVRCVTQAAVYLHRRPVTIAEEVGHAEEMLEPCWWAADNDWIAAYGADEDFTGLWRVLTFHISSCL